MFLRPQNVGWYVPHYRSHQERDYISPLYNCCRKVYLSHWACLMTIHFLWLIITLENICRLDDIHRGNILRIAFWVRTLLQRSYMFLYNFTLSNSFCCAFVDQTLNCGSVNFYWHVNLRKDLCRQERTDITSPFGLLRLFDWKNFWNSCITLTGA